ncbi:helix-turn-helix domain-containing protein [Pedobacter sp. SYSU D00535]|uniref:helix-turn-helix domain-containing protein n=1 Tax=Pedobacter sp. SYSU D00535 TaxID=2810308 RepID=UPI001A956531|nr:helix-turn-helix domain-containing protein [Pedobacter sp. SYSU D00535]
MENLTFEQLPEAIRVLIEKVNNIEALLTDLRQKESDEDKIYTVAEAAAFLNLSIHTIYSKVSRQEIPVNKQGKKLYFYKSELIQWIRAGKVKTTAELELEANGFLEKRKALRSSRY